VNNDNKRGKKKIVIDRAKPFEAPGKCLDCSNASCTDIGWYCIKGAFALTTTQKRCPDFLYGVPNGESEPSVELRGQLRLGDI